MKTLRYWAATFLVNLILFPLWLVVMAIFVPVFLYHVLWRAPA